MPNEVSTKIQVAIWWITSIAVSVLCCSILFVLFASYLVEVKEAGEENQVRIKTVEERESRILEEIELLRKHVVVQAPAAVTSSGIPVSASPPASIVIPPALVPSVTIAPAPPEQPVPTQK